MQAEHEELQLANYAIDYAFEYAKKETNRLRIERDYYKAKLDQDLAERKTCENQRLIGLRSFQR